MTRFAVSAMALVLAGCATAPTDLAFAPSSAVAGGTANLQSSQEQALLVVAVGAISMGGAYQFQRIDTEQLVFADDPVALSFGAWGVGDRMARPEGERGSMWVLRDEINFLVRPVAPGTYAASHASWSTYNGVSSGTAWTCQDSGAPTFELQAGQINLVLSSDAFPPGTLTRLSTTFTVEEVLDQFARTRTVYPNLHGDPVILAPTLEARWVEAPAGFFGSPCQDAVAGTLSLNAIRSAADSRAAPDAAEQAALAAARANLQRQDAAGDTDSPNVPK